MLIAGILSISGYLVWVVETVSSLTALSNPELSMQIAEHVQGQALGLGSIATLGTLSAFPWFLATIKDSWRLAKMEGKSLLDYMPKWMKNRLFYSWSERILSTQKKTDPQMRRIARELRKAQG